MNLQVWRNILQKDGTVKSSCHTTSFHMSEMEEAKATADLAQTYADPTKHWMTVLSFGVDGGEVITHYSTKKES